VHTKVDIYIFTILVHLINCLNPMLTGGRAWSLPIYRYDRDVPLERSTFSVSNI